MIKRIFESFWPLSAQWMILFATFRQKTHTHTNEWLPIWALNLICEFFVSFLSTRESHWNWIFYCDTIYFLSIQMRTCLTWKIFHNKSNHRQRQRHTPTYTHTYTLYIYTQKDKRQHDRNHFNEPVPNRFNWIIQRKTKTTNHIKRNECLTAPSLSLSFSFKHGNENVAMRSTFWIAFHGVDLSIFQLSTPAKALVLALALAFSVRSMDILTFSNGV